MSSETIHYSYEVIVHFRNGGKRFPYGRLKPAKVMFNYLKKKGCYSNLSLFCVCVRYDNHGEVYIGRGSDRKTAYENTLPYINR